MAQWRDHLVCFQVVTGLNPLLGELDDKTLCLLSSNRERLVWRLNNYYAETVIEWDDQEEQTFTDANDKVSGFQPY